MATQNEYRSAVIPGEDHFWITSSTAAGKVEICHDQVSNAAIHVYPALQLPRNCADEKLIIKLHLLKFVILSIL